MANHVFSGHRERGLDEVKEQKLVIRVYDEAGNVIETHEHAREFKGSEFVFASENGTAAINNHPASSRP